MAEQMHSACAKHCMREGDGAYSSKVLSLQRGRHYHMYVRRCNLYQEAYVHIILGNTRRTMYTMEET